MYIVYSANNFICMFYFNLKYWMFKLRALPNDTQLNLFLLNNDDRSRLQANFTSFLTIAASVPSTLTLLLNTYLAKK